MLNIKELKKVLFIDTETTGINPHTGAKPFSIIYAVNNEPIVYLSLISYGGTVQVASTAELHKLRSIIANCDLVVMHNAKFDMHMLANIDIHINGAVWCTMANHKLIRNDLLSYALGKLTGNKSDEVAKWIKANPKLGKIRVNGKLQKAFFKVPFDIIKPYAVQDVEATRKLFYWQVDKILELAEENAGVLDVLRTECETTAMLYRVERRGMLVDEAYTRTQIEATKRRQDMAESAFTSLTGLKFVNSGKFLAPLFAKLGITLELTKKNNPKTGKAALAAMKHPVANLVLQIRETSKKRKTYFENFINLRGKDGAIHCNFKQCGADTMRMSCATPNLQNVPAEDDSDTPVRGCFIPREGFKYVSIDFSAQEMRCVIDSAREDELAAKIIAGHDVHEATGKLMGVSRKIGKNLGFSILYGSGIARLANGLSITIDEARRLKALYFDRLPRVKMLSNALTNTAEMYGCIVTRYGNTLFVDPDSAYAATNYFVQGTCAIHTKKAAVAVDKMLHWNGAKSAIVCVIHDEILLEMHLSELHLIPEIRSLMEKAYPHAILPMGTSVEVYVDRWGGVVCGEIAEFC